MIESTDEELAEAIDEARRELDALRPGNYQPNSLNTGDQGRVLPTAARNVDGQRRADYGPALESFQRIADIASAGLAHKLTEPLEPEDICWLLLYALKGSRAAQGLRTGTFHRDTYADTAGYAAVAEFIAHARQDIPALLAAVEAVLELHKPSLGLHRATTPTVEFCRECGLAYPCDTVTAIRTALGEEAT